MDHINGCLLVGTAVKAERLQNDFKIEWTGPLWAQGAEFALCGSFGVNQTFLQAGY